MFANEPANIGELGTYNWIDIVSWVVNPMAKSLEEYKGETELLKAKAKIAEEKAKKSESQAKTIKFIVTEKPMFLKFVEAVPNWAYWTVGGAFSLLLIISMVKKK